MRRHRGRYRGPAAPPRLAAAWPRPAGILRSMASIRWSPRRSPGHRDGSVSRAASASIKRSRRAAGSILPCGGEKSRPGIARDIEEIQRDVASICRTGQARDGQARSSRRRASPCRQSAAQGRRPAQAWRRGRRPRAARSIRPFGPGADEIAPAPAGVRGRPSGRNVQRDDTAGSESSENASSSSSMSPSATIRGRIAASLPSTSRKMPCASRPARRVGR